VAQRDGVDPPADHAALGWGVRQVHR
jgi:hypothetical protein